MRRGTIAAVPIASALVIAFAACTSKEDPDCDGLCGGQGEPTLVLTCPAEIISATLTGPCAPGSTEDPERERTDGTIKLGFFCLNRGATPFVDCSEVGFETSGPGDCHIEIDFTDGFVYSGDVHYTEQAQCCPTSFLSPSPTSLTVSNPNSSCIVDAGADE